MNTYADKRIRIFANNSKEFSIREKTFTSFIEDDRVNCRVVTISTKERFEELNRHLFIGINEWK